MTHAELIARLRSRAGYVATLSTDRNLMREAADALEATTGDDAVERGAEAAHYAQGFDDYGVANEDEMEDARGIARAVLNAATGDGHE